MGGEGGIRRTEAEGEESIIGEIEGEREAAGEGKIGRFERESEGEVEVGGCSSNKHSPP